MATALIRDDGGPSLVLDGNVSMTVSHPGRLTDKAVVDRTFVVDGRIVLPKLSTLDLLVSPNPIVDGVQTGDARISEVIDWLENAKLNSLIMTIQRPGWPPVTDMMVETFARTMSSSDTPSFNVSFKEVRIAKIRSTTLAQAASKSKGKPKARVGPGLEGESDLGTKPTKELNISALRTIEKEAEAAVKSGKEYLKKYLYDPQPAWISDEIPGK